MIILGSFLLWIRAIKWFLLIRFLSRENRFAQVLDGCLSGLVVGFFTPGRVGEVIRIAKLKGDKYILALLVFFDRLIDLYVVIIMSFISSLFLFKHKILYLMGAMFVFILLNYFFYLIFSQNKAIRNRHSFFNKLFDSINYIKEIPKIYIFNVIGLTILFYIIIMLQFYFILKGFKASVALEEVLLVPIVQLSNILPITIGGYGIRELLFVYFSNKMNLSNEVLVNASIIWPIQLLVTAIAIKSIIFIINNRLKIKTMFSNFRIDKL
jgi:uncharacterized membrane protein YbhN (UPF0104 family)